MDPAITISKCRKNILCFHLHEGLWIIQRCIDAILLKEGSLPFSNGCYGFYLKSWLTLKKWKIRYIRSAFIYLHPNFQTHVQLVTNRIMYTQKERAKKTNLVFTCIDSRYFFYFIIIFILVRLELGSCWGILIFLIFIFLQTLSS